MLQGNLLTSGPPAVDGSATFERIRLDDTSWVDVARGFVRERALGMVATNLAPSPFLLLPFTWSRAGGLDVGGGVVTGGGSRRYAILGMTPFEFRIPWAWPSRRHSQVHRRSSRPRDR